MQAQMYKEHPVSISKSINFSADKDDFFVEYSLYTFESHLNCMSADQMKRVAEVISEFLEKYGENGKREVHWEVMDKTHLFYPCFCTSEYCAMVRLFYVIFK